MQTKYGRKGKRPAGGVPIRAHDESSAECNTIKATNTDLGVIEEKTRTRGKALQTQGEKPKSSNFMHRIQATRGASAQTRLARKSDQGNEQDSEPASIQRVFRTREEMEAHRQYIEELARPKKRFNQPLGESEERGNTNQAGAPRSHRWPDGKPK